MASAAWHFVNSTSAFDFIFFFHTVFLAAVERFLGQRNANREREGERGATEDDASKHK